MSNESDETPVAPRANLGSDYQGRNTSAPENVWDMLNSANMNLDPMTSTLMTSQVCINYPVLCETIISSRFNHVFFFELDALSQTVDESERKNTIHQRNA